MLLEDKGVLPPGRRPVFERIARGESVPDRVRPEDTDTIESAGGMRLASVRRSLPQSLGGLSSTDTTASQAGQEGSFHRETVWSPAGASVARRTTVRTTAAPRPIQANSRSKVENMP
ncbi:hypothetical protein ACWGR4_39440 [Embleya sp. NPDC055664]